MNLSALCFAFVCAASGLCTASALDEERCNDAASHGALPIKSGRTLIQSKATRLTRDGSLARTELSTADPALVAQTLQTLDQNHNGKVDRDEIAAFAKAEGFDDQSAVEEFESHDKDGDGVLGYDEVALALGQLSSTESLDMPVMQNAHSSMALPAAFLAEHAERAHRAGTHWEPAPFDPFHPPDDIAAQLMASGGQEVDMPDDPTDLASLAKSMEARNSDSHSYASAPAIPAGLLDSMGPSGDSSEHHDNAPALDDVAKMGQDLLSQMGDLSNMGSDLSRKLEQDDVPAAQAEHPAISQPEERPRIVQTITEPPATAAPAPPPTEAPAPPPPTTTEAPPAPSPAPLTEAPATTPPPAPPAPPPPPPPVTEAPVTDAPPPAAASTTQDPVTAQEDAAGDSADAQATVAPSTEATGTADNGTANGSKVLPAIVGPPLELTDAFVPQFKDFDAFDVENDDANDECAAARNEKILNTSHPNALTSAMQVKTQSAEADRLLRCALKDEEQAEMLQAKALAMSASVTKRAQEAAAQAAQAKATELMLLLRQTEAQARQMEVAAAGFEAEALADVKQATTCQLAAHGLLSGSAGDSEAVRAHEALKSEQLSAQARAAGSRAAEAERRQGLLKAASDAKALFVKAR